MLFAADATLKAWPYKHIDFLSAVSDASGHWRSGLDQNDGHPNDAGHAAMYSAIDPTYFAQFSCTTLPPPSPPPAPPRPPPLLRRRSPPPHARQRSDSAPQKTSKVAPPTRRRHAPPPRRAAKLFVAKAAALDSYEVVGALLVAHANAKKAATPRKLEALLQKNELSLAAARALEALAEAAVGPQAVLANGVGFSLAAATRGPGGLFALARRYLCGKKQFSLYLDFVEAFAPANLVRRTRVADGRGFVGEVATLAADPTSLLIVAARRAVGRARGLVAYPQLVSLKVGAWTLATHDGSRPVADVLGSCDGVVVDVLGDVKEVPKESGAVLAAASARLAALAAPKKRVPPIAAAGVDDDDFPFVSPSPTHRVLPGFEAPARPKKQQDFDGGDALAALVSPPSDARPTPAFA